MSNSRQASHSFTRLLNAAQEKASQYSVYRAEDDEEKVLSSLYIVEQIFPDQALMLCSTSHPRLSYVSKNCLAVLGYSDREFASKLIQDFFNLVHPDDVEGVQRCFEFINASEPYDPETNRFVLYYRIRNKEGQYLHLKDEKLAVRTAGNQYVYFTLFRNVAEEPQFTQVKMDVIRLLKGKYLKVHTYHPRQPERLMTPRQHDIADLIVRGFSNPQIAKRLNLSVNTVKNHKQHLFKKINVRNSMELAHFARTMMAD
jgi:DNA-binding CsgD family transcriptional regulator